MAEKGSQGNLFSRPEFVVRFPEESMYAKLNYLISIDETDLIKQGRSYFECFISEPSVAICKRQEFYQGEL